MDRMVTYLALAVAVVATAVAFYALDRASAVAADPATKVVERTADDGLPSPGVAGADNLRLMSDEGERFFLTFYEFGAMQAVDHASEQLETWMFDRSDGTWRPVITQRLAESATQLQLRNPFDTNSLIFTFPPDGDPKVWTEKEGTGLTVAPEGPLILAGTSVRLSAPVHLAETGRPDPPSDGGLLYVEGGRLWFLTADGTATPVAG